MIDHPQPNGGEPDIESNGSEMDGSCGEDDFCDHNGGIHQFAPGCPISDPVWDVDDEGEDDRDGGV